VERTKRRAQRHHDDDDDSNIGVLELLTEERSCMSYVAIKIQNCRRSVRACNSFMHY
jgi:hypothetical protein